MKAVAAALLVWCVPAAADPAPDPDPVPPFVADRVAVRGALELGQVTSLAVDGWYDLNERFRLGLTMTDDARHLIATGRGLCLRACASRFGGLAAEGQVRIGPALVGRAAIETVRFAPTVAAIELGAEARYVDGRIAVLVAPTLRLGIVRRDLANHDTGALFAQLAVRVWRTGGVLGLARTAVGFDDLGARPSVGAAAGGWLELGPITVSVRAGASEVLLSRTRDSLVAEVAIAWQR